MALAERRLHVNETLRFELAESPITDVGVGSTVCTIQLGNSTRSPTAGWMRWDRPNGGILPAASV